MFQSEVSPCTNILQTASFEAPNALTMFAHNIRPALNLAISMKYLELVAKLKRILGATSSTERPASIIFPKYSAPDAKEKPNSSTIEDPELLNKLPVTAITL